MTDEELGKLWKIFNNSQYGIKPTSYNPRDDYWKEYQTTPSPKKHNWKPTLLIFSTVYNCSCCGIKKEDATSEYCEEPKKQDDNNNWGYTGGW